MSVSISVGWAVLDFYEDPLVVSVFGKALGFWGGGGGVFFKNLVGFSLFYYMGLNKNLGAFYWGTQS